jgi:hypothetical protein
MGGLCLAPHGVCCSMCINTSQQLHHAMDAGPQGDAYFKTEKARVERILSSGSVHASKAEQLSKKASVLSAFVDEE